MLDLNRFMCMDQLDQEEREYLLIRTLHNVQELHKFLDNGSDEKLSLQNVSTKEAAEKLMNERMD
jgi:hypothetical protein